MAHPFKRILITFGAALGLSAIGASLLLWFREQERKKISETLSEVSSLVNSKSSTTVISDSDTVAVSPRGFVPRDVAPAPCVVKPFDCGGKSAAECMQQKKAKKVEGSSGNAKDLFAVYKERRSIPTNILSCDCRIDKITEEQPTDESSTFESDTDFNADLQLPQIHPIAYETYSPINLTKVAPEDEKKGLSPKSLRGRKKLVTPNILTPFHPTLNAIAYGHKHAQLIQELLDNYLYLE
ncbi:hypothetical protein QR680_016553 [Steinernema hermaphroditum]|uniref:Uncharacterized protein n=1 Tax=Steinernema hermaphroditum TaxID=289476 RepID=A0AA39HBK1_9BILA|nr:hypothetical protein QR680_016553 [Steinernema hermaphroditum]